MEEKKLVYLVRGKDKPAEFRLCNACIAFFTAPKRIKQEVTVYRHMRYIGVCEGCELRKGKK